MKNSVLLNRNIIVFIFFLLLIFLPYFLFRQRCIELPMTSSARHTCQISFIVLKVPATILLEHDLLQMLTAFLNSLLIACITFLILFYPSFFICFILWISILYLRSYWGLKFSGFFITCDIRSKICRRVQLSHHFPNVTINFN